MDKGVGEGEAGGGAKGEKEVGGEVDVQLRWAHNPQKERPVVHLNEVQSLVPLPGEGTAMAGERHERQRNELLVTLVGAKNLMVMDKAMVYGEGSTDPVVTLKVDGVGKVRQRQPVTPPPYRRTTAPPHQPANPPSRQPTINSSPPWERHNRPLSRRV